MKIEIQLDESFREPKIIIQTDQMTEEIRLLLQRLDSTAPGIVGFRDGQAEFLAPERILRVYAASGKVYAATDGGEYSLRLRLYEAEEKLDPRSFVRISHAELINLSHARQFDLSLSGTICVRMSDGSSCYVSRRYVSKIKQLLGL